MNDKPSGERKKSQEFEPRMGRYELVRPLGRGGMAEVFLARQTAMAGFSKQLVIKRVLPELVDDARFVAMFLDEARLAARLTHPNICQVFELGEVNGQYFIAMEHVAGVTLTSLMVQGRDKQLLMPLAAAFRIVAQLCEALAYAHQLADDLGRPLNLVHRDVTPSNVMVTPDGSVKLLDFGIARAADRTHLTQIGVAKGKLGFMSPEQLRSPQDIDHRSDLFAVGAVMYTLLCGKTPYADVIKTAQGMREMAHGRFPPPRAVNPSLPEPVEQLILRAMAPDPLDRFLSALEFHRELERVAMTLSLSLGPHALLEYMADLGREVSERPTRKLHRPSSEQVVKVDTGDVVNGNTPLPSHLPNSPARSGLPLLLLGMGAVLLVGALVVMKLAQATPDEVTGPLPISAAPLAAVVAAPDAAVDLPPEPAVAAPEPAVAQPVPVAPEPATQPVPSVKPAPLRPVKVRPPPVTGPSGTLIVEATPRAKVFIGNLPLGSTPLRVKVAVGAHRLKVDYGTSAHQLIINVVEDRETAVRDQAD